MAKRYQRGNQNPYIEEEQTTQWPKDTHCVVCSSSIYRFWLPLWYLLVIVLSVLLQYTDSDYPFGIFWPLCCLFFFNIPILITPLVSVQNLYIEEGQTTQWPKDTKGVIRIRILKKNRQHNDQKIPLWYLLVIVLSVLLQYTDSDYPFGICWPLCCLSFFNIQILITP
jgi:hypothetical protein